MSEPAWAHLLFGGAYCYVRRFCSVEVVNLELEWVVLELRRKTRDQNTVFFASSCMQILHENPVRHDIFPCRVRLY